MEEENFSTTANLGVKREHKDSIFRLLFREPANALSLCNEVNGTSYENAEDPCSNQKKEVFDMCLTEFNEDQLRETCYEEGRIEEQERSIQILAELCKELGGNIEQVAQKIAQKYNMSVDSALTVARKYW